MVFSPRVLVIMDNLPQNSLSARFPVRLFLILLRADRSFVDPVSFISYHGDNHSNPGKIY